MKFISVVFLLGCLSLAGQEKNKEISNALSELTGHAKSFRGSLRNEDLTATKRVALALKYLLIAEKHLGSTKQPTTDPLLNVSPPGSGRAGVDPASIQNPEDRRKYEEAIAANLALIEAHKAWREANRIKQDAIGIISGELRGDHSILLDETNQQLWKQLPAAVRQEVETNRLNK